MTGGIEPEVCDCYRVIEKEFLENKNVRKARHFGTLWTFYLVGVTRFELVASWTRTMHATKLRYTPIDFKKDFLSISRVNAIYYNAVFSVCQPFFSQNLRQYDSAVKIPVYSTE